MQMVSYDGVAATTDDAVAEALLDLAISVARYSRYERVTFPVRVGGADEQLTLMLGPTIHISALTISSSDAVAVAGSADAAARIRKRIEVLNDPLHVGEDEPGLSVVLRP